MELSIRRICLHDGERYLVLVDETGMPLFYPALYITAIVRGSSKATNTIQNSLTAIKALFAWQLYAGIDIEHRFSKGDFLEENEVHALRDFMQRPLNEDVSNKKVYSIKTSNPRPKSISFKVQYSRMTVIADYLDFLSKQLHKGTVDKKFLIQRMVSQIKDNRPKISNKNKNHRSDVHLNDELLDKLEQALKPGSETNPISDYGVQVRNALMFTILRTAGIRRGELLNIKIEDIDFSANTLSIVRRHDTKADVRMYQPVVKTREREIPIDPLLAIQIHDYVLKIRAKIFGVRKHDYLFVTHKQGPSCGRPLSNAGFSKFIGEIKKITTEYAHIHAHAFRHAWNYNFSKLCDENGLSPEREEKLRSYLMGWNPTSGTAAIYNERHIEEKAGKAVLELQERYFRKDAGG